MTIIDRAFTYRGSIKVSSKDLELARSGKKICTVRLGRIGVAREILSLTDGASSLNVKIVRIDDSRTYDQLTDQDAILDGLESRHALDADLSRFYGEIEPKQPMTLIFFEKL